MIAEKGHLYAQIVSGKCHWKFTADDLPEWNDEQCPAADITNMIPAPEIGWEWDGTTFHPPAAFSSQEWLVFQIRAQAALEQTDKVALRCFKAGVAFPPQWNEYAQALRNIVRSSSGDPANPFPVRPAFPEGT